jgi:hypothetical protein
MFAGDDVPSIYEYIKRFEEAAQVAGVTNRVIAQNLSRLHNEWAETLQEENLDVLDEIAPTLTGYLRANRLEPANYVKTIQEHVCIFFNLLFILLSFRLNQRVPLCFSLASWLSWSLLT